MALSPVRAAIEARKKAQQNKNLASAQYIKNEAPKPVVDNFASDIKQIRSAQNQGLGVERPLASSASDREAILKSRGQKLPVKSTQQPAQQQAMQQPAQQVQQDQPAEAPDELIKPQQQAETSSMSPAGQMPGIDKQALLNAGVPQEAIDEIMLKYQPQQQALQKVAADQKTLLDETKSSLDAEQKDTEQLLGSVRSRKEQLFEEEKQLIDLSAETQKGIAEQQYQKSKFLNEQAKAQFELEMEQTERKQSIANDERETALRRALGAQLGANFSGRGLEMSLTEKRRGEELLGDLRAKTAIGRAEFSFRAIDIEKEYANNLKSIEVDRRDQSLQNMNRLDDELTAIDQQVLLTRQQKAEAARKAMKDFFDKQEEIDLKSGELVSSAVEDVFKKKKELEQEKLEREAFSMEQSKALGYFANKFGEPINTGTDGTPKPFVMDYNEKLSQQFGHLVDDYGRKILGDNKQPIPYRDPSLISFQNALAGFQGGDYSEANKSALNFRLGSNNTIAGALQNGKSYPSPKYGKLQCGEYINDQFLANRMLGHDFANADQLIKQYGGKPGTFAPMVGDVVFMDTGDPKIPHKAIVEGMDEQGNLILTDANYVGPGVVRHGWKIAQGDNNYKKIYGFARLPLNSKTGLAQPALTTNIGGTDNRGGGDPTLDNLVISYEDYKKLGIEEKRSLAAQGYTEAKVRSYFENKDAAPQGSNDPLENLKSNPASYWKLKDTEREELKSIYGKEVISAIISGKPIPGSKSANMPTKSLANVGWVEEAISSAYGDAEGGEAQARKLTEFQNYIQKGQYAQAKSAARQALLEKAPQKVKDGLQDANTLKQDYEELKTALNEIKDAGESTGITEGTTNEILAKLKQTRDPRFVKLDIRAQKALSNYIKAVSGTAASDTEVERIKKLFPDLSKPLDENFQVIEEGINDAVQTLNNTVYNATNGRFSSLETMNQALDGLTSDFTYMTPEQTASYKTNFNTLKGLAKGAASKAKSEALTGLKNYLLGNKSQPKPSAPQSGGYASLLGGNEQPNYAQDQYFDKY